MARRDRHARRSTACRSGASPHASVLRQRPGHYFWQAYLTGEAADGAEEPIGPVQELVVTLPAADRGRGKLFPRFGRRGRRSFYLSSDGLPGDRRRRALPDARQDDRRRAGA